MADSNNSQSKPDGNDVDATDMTLVGIDGESVQVTKASLSSQSPVFRQMFGGNFRESEKDCKAVELSYTAPTLREIVKFCSSPDDYKVTLNIEDDDSVSALFELLDATIYFELKGIEKAISKIQWSFPFAFDVLQRLVDQGITFNNIWMVCRGEMQFQQVLLNPSKCGFDKISLELLERIVPYSSCGYFGSKMVSGIKAWKKAHEPITEETQSRLQAVANRIDLYSMGIRRVAMIEPCSLFPRDRLYDELVKCAMDYDERGEYMIYESGTPPDSGDDSDY